MQTPPSFSAPVSGATPPPMRVRFAAIGEAWNLIRQDWAPWVVAILVLVVATYAAEFVALPALMLVGAASGTTKVGANAPSATLVIGVVAVYAFTLALVAVVQGLMSTLPQRLALRRLRGESSGLNDLFTLDGAVWTVGLWWLLYPVLTMIVPFVLFAVAALVSGGFSSRANPGLVASSLVVAYVLMIVSFLVIQSLFAFVPLLIIDRRMTVIEAAKLSAKTLGRQLPAICGVYFCAMLVSFIGACACGVGFLVTGSILYATIGVIYNDFFRPEAVVSEGSQEWYPRPG
ncbi:MAG: hypothetical protein ACYC96_09265 [Fimbriimonadaceae bacterium]